MYSLVGIDGNAFNVLGYVSRALRREGLSAEIPSYMEKAQSGDYGNLLAVSMDYVEKANDSVMRVKYNPKYVWDEIVDAINDVAKEHPVDESLLENGKITITYNNGNDGTDFDWNANGRTCEFGVSYSNDYYYIKAWLTTSGMIEGYYYETPETMSGVEFSVDCCDEDDACMFARYMQHFFDDKHLWDEPVLNHVDFSPVQEVDIYNDEILTEEEREEREREEEECDDWYDEDDEDEDEYEDDDE